MPKPTTILLLTLALTACAHAPSPPPPPDAIETPEAKGFQLPTRLDQEDIACKDGDARACQRIAEDLTSWIERQACKDLPHPQSRECELALRPVELASAQRTRSDLADTYYDAAIALYKDQCDAGVAQACLSAGRLLKRTGSDYMTAYPFYERAEALFEPACLNKNKEACASLNAMYSGSKRVHYNNGLRVHFEHLSCGAGDRHSCKKLFRPLTPELTLYTPPPPKPSSAPLYDTSAFDISGMSVLASSPAPPDPTPYQPACKRGNPFACYEAAVRTEDPEVAKRHLTKAHKALKRKCEKGKAHACLGLGLIIKTGVVTPPSDEATHQHFTRACQLGSAPACTYLGLKLVQSDDPDKGLELLGATCDKHPDSGSCAILGVARWSGLGGRSDLDAAHSALDAGCKAGDERSCRLFKTLEWPRSR